MTRNEIKEQMAARFDRPTPHAMRSIFVKRAKKDKLLAFVGVKNHAMAKTAGAALDTLGQ